MHLLRSLFSRSLAKVATAQDSFSLCSARWIFTRRFTRISHYLNAACFSQNTNETLDWPALLFHVVVQALPDGILNNLVTMIDYMKEGEFVRANDIYLLTAIGNAPWPIGLTMVGIHERSGAIISVLP